LLICARKKEDSGIKQLKGTYHGSNDYINQIIYRNVFNYIDTVELGLKNKRLVNTQVTYWTDPSTSNEYFILNLYNIFLIIDAYTMEIVNLFF
jgi:hypothetical protein